jgi:hypothetical protein
VLDDEGVPRQVAGLIRTEPEDAIGGLFGAADAGREEFSSCTSPPPRRGPRVRCGRNGFKRRRRKGTWNERVDAMFRVAHSNAADFVRATTAALVAA